MSHTTKRGAAAPLVDLGPVGIRRRLLRVGPTPPPPPLPTRPPLGAGPTPRHQPRAPQRIAPPPPYTLTKAAAGAYLGVSERTIETMIADGRLPSFLLGARRLIRRIDLEAYADRQSAAGYALILPTTVAEARAAAAQVERQANTLLLRGARDEAGVYAALAGIFRRQAGIGDDPEEERG